MVQRTRHRGQHPADAALFGAANYPKLQAAVAELSWLLTRGYATKSSLKLVGDRHELHQRQRKAVLGAACSAGDLRRRRETQIALEQLSGKRVLIDGFNSLIVLESALSGAMLFRGRDGCLRDLAGVHGSWRRVEETHQAIRLLGTTLQRCEPAETVWLLDAPVSNSGRLAGFIREAAERENWPWRVELHNNPDRTLIDDRTGVCVTSDAWVLNEAAAWVNPLEEALGELPGAATVVDLSVCEERKNGDRH